MSYPAFHLDFYSDWMALLKNDLANIGYSVADLSDEKVQIAYFNVKKRLIEPIKRNVIKSKEFTCPPERYAGLQRLEQEINNGNNLKPYLSKFILDIHYNDNLLNHWGIYHLHLGEYIEESGFIKREGPVLYVRFDKFNAYFIDVRGHNSWSEQSLIQIVHDNWPQTIAEFRYPASARLVYQATDSDVSKLRKANINSPVGVNDGTIYGIIGGGAALNGVGVEIVDLMLNTKAKIKKWQESVETNIVSIVNDGVLKGVKFSDIHEIKLDFDNSVAYAVEKNHLFYFELGML